MKTEVYSWRVSTALKSDLEREARRRKVSLSAALDLAAREWLKSRKADEDDEAEQKRLYEAALKCIGTIASGNPNRSQQVRQLVRERLKQKYGR